VLTIATDSATPLYIVTLSDRKTLCQGLDAILQKRTHTNRFIIGTTVLIKSLLTSLYQREVLYPSLAKRGKGRFSDVSTFNFKTLNTNNPISIFFIIM